MRCADASATAGFEDAFDDFSRGSTAAESDASGFHAAAGAQFGDFTDLSDALSSPVAPSGAGSVATERKVADLIAQLPDLTYMLEHSVAPRAPA